MKISAKTRLICLIVALVFAFGGLIGTGTYMIINHLNKLNATTSTDYIIEDNLYNTDGTLNATAVAEFLDAIGYDESENISKPYQANQILSRNNSASYSGDKTIVFKMGYYTPKGGNASNMDTSKPIIWQATYLWSGKDNKPYLTIWMARSYTSDYFNNGASSNSGWKTSSTSYSLTANYSNSLAREVTKNIYEALSDSLTGFSDLIVSPSDARATWQATQQNAWYSSSQWSITNGMQTNTNTGGTSMSNVNKWGWSWDGTVYEDMFWLPSHVEVFNTPDQSGAYNDRGLWGITSANDRKDASNTALDGKGTSQYCWLRSGSL